MASKQPHRRLYVVEWNERRPFGGREFYVFTNKRVARKNMRDELSLGEQTHLYEITLPAPSESLEMNEE